MGSFLSFLRPALDEDDSISDVESDEDEEPFEFHLLPTDLVNLILTKLSYKELSVFDQCSKLSHRCYSELQHKPEIFVMLIRVDKDSIVALNHRNHPATPFELFEQHNARVKAHELDLRNGVGNSRIAETVEIFKKQRTTASNIWLFDRIAFDVDHLEMLIKTVSAEGLLVEHQFFPLLFYQSLEIQKLKSLRMDTCGCTDEEFLKLKVSFFVTRNDFISDKGFNRFLKQWRRHEREISLISIDFDATAGTRNFEIILEGLDVNPVWSPELHSSSFLSIFPIEEIAMRGGPGPHYIYSLIDPHDLDTYYILRLTPNYFRIYSSESQSEIQLLLSFLTDDQHYAIMRRCYYCQTEFCEHRRRYTMPRMKNNCPRLYNSVMAVVPALSFVFRAVNVLHSIVLNDCVFLNFI